MWNPPGCCYHPMHTARTILRSTNPVPGVLFTRSLVCCSLRYGPYIVNAGALCLPARLFPFGAGSRLQDPLTPVLLVARKSHQAIRDVDISVFVARVAVGWASWLCPQRSGQYSQVIRDVYCSSRPSSRRWSSAVVAFPTSWLQSSRKLRGYNTSQLC